MAGSNLDIVIEIFQNSGQGLISARACVFRMNINEQSVDLVVDYEGLRYSGTTHIDVEGVGATVRINSVDLDITGVWNHDRPVAFRLHPESEELEIGPLVPGHASMRIEFRGRVAQDSLKGFYRSSFGPTYILTTQFEPTDARRFIPCADHPSHKAVFRFRVRVPKDVKVVFNTRPERIDEVGSERVWTFLPTPRMSSYLLYLGVGPFEELARTVEGHEIVCACPPGRKDEGEYAVEQGGHLLALFEEYYGIPYPLDKLHLIPVPDYESGAMENWGAITFREMYLLVHKNSSTFTRMICTSVLSHEIAHQWFGNLVTMKWWNDLWLNESFATFMGYKMEDRLHPEWDRWAEFITQRTSVPLMWDALGSTHPIDVRVEDPHQIGEIFDEISYGKGANILRMIEGFLGPEIFRRGISQYLKRFAYSNAEGRDLWQSLEEASNQPVSRIMSEWIRRPGYPIIRVAVRDGALHLEQDRFRIDGGRESETPWPVPMQVWAEGKVQSVLFEGRQMMLPLSDPPYVVLNPGRLGFYRVRYDQNLSARLRAHWKDMSPTDRYGVIQDLYAFLLAGDASLSEYLQFIAASQNDSSHLVSDEIRHEFLWLYPVLAMNPSFIETFSQFFRTQLAGVGTTPRDDETEVQRVLRGRLCRALVTLDPEFCRQMAAQYTQYDTISADLRSAILTAYARCGGEPEFQELNRRMNAAPNDEERTRVARALVNFRSRDIILKSLDLIVAHRVSPTIALEMLFEAILGPDSLSAAWEWTSHHFDEVLGMYRGSLILSALLQHAVPYFSLDHEAELQKILSSADLRGGEAGLTKGLSLGKVFTNLRRRAMAAPSE
jgi:tricorn protease interacting factor F2/3